MLEVHAPHEPIHTWKNFLIHISAIVIGLLIAVGLGQAVEFFQHRDQREELEAALRRDGEANRGYIKSDIATAQRVLDWALGQSAALERAGSTGALILHPMPPGLIGSPDAGVWPSARASGVTRLLPASAQNWLEYLAEVYNDTFVSSASAARQLYLGYAALDQVIIGRAIELRPETLTFPGSRQRNASRPLSLSTPSRKTRAMSCVNCWFTIPAVRSSFRRRSTSSIRPKRESGIRKSTGTR